MDTALVLLSTGLVGYKYLESKQKAVKISPTVEPIVEMEPELRPVGEARTLEDFKHFEEIVTDHTPRVEKVQPETQMTDADLPKYIASVRNATVMEKPLKKLPASKDDGTGVKDFGDQFFPQDSKSTGNHSLGKTPWMRALEVVSNAGPREEKELVHPSEETDKDDIYGKDIPAIMRERERHQAKTTISNFKQFEKPIEEEWTANGEGRGLHPIKRYHKFLLSDQPVVELPEGPRGNFASGANRSSLASNLNNNKGEIHVSHTGPATGPTTKTGIPPASFKLDASNAEGYLLEKHIGANARGPVNANSNNDLIQKSFTLAHDDRINTLPITKGAGIDRTHVEQPVGRSNGELATRERGVATPAVVGAAGGVRHGHVDKNSDFKTTTGKENLSADSQRLTASAGKKSMTPAFVSNAEHAHAEKTFAEEERSATNIRGAPLLRKAADVSQFNGESQFSLENSKDTINENPFTSKNFAAPQNKTLPSFLRIAPTASISLSGKDLTLKSGDSAMSGVTDLMGLGRGSRVSTIKTSNLSEKKPEEKETKLRTVMINRTTRGVSVSNPYSNPRPMISEN